MYYDHSVPPHQYPSAPPSITLPPYMAQPVSSRAPCQWSSGLGHCCDDPANCLITCSCRCITFGQIADMVDSGSCTCTATRTIYALLCCFTGFVCLYSCFFRLKLRGQYDLEDGPLPDCLVHVCCESFALCQDYRELKNRGFDMGIGWNANINRQRRGIVGSPVMRFPAMPGMTR